MSASATALPRVLQPFALRQYRWLAAGLALALFADGVWLIALVWQVIDLGGGPGQVSMVSATAAVGMIASTLFGGVLADRMSQRKIVIALEIIKLVAFGAVGLASVTGVLTYPLLMAAALLGGVTTGMYYPAYSALLPRIVAPAQLLAANGIEGFMRPVLYQAAGPMIAGVIISATSPGLAIIVGALGCIASGACYVAMGPVVDEPGTDPASADRARHPITALFTDLGEGFAYMWRTAWLWATLFYFSFVVLLVMGPLEVLVPFALRDRAGGDASSHALVLAAFGVGAALGAFVFAARDMPRRYLTLLFCFWSICAAPMAIMGFARHTYWFVLAGFLMGLLMDGPMVLWGTLLQRRVPKELLGRISALDFFVSVALMPVSMALAAPLSHLIGLTATFVLAGLLPFPAAFAFYFAARLWRDEIAHPLAILEEDVPLRDTDEIARPAEGTHRGPVQQ